MATFRLFVVSFNLNLNRAPKLESEWKRDPTATAEKRAEANFIFPLDAFSWKAMQ